MDVKEKAIRIVPQVKSTNIVFTAVLVIAASALISMPQMIGLANAQSERASERACPVPGFMLSRGECTAEPITRPGTCEPSMVAGLPVRQAGEVCSVIGRPSFIFEQACDAIEGSVFTVIDRTATCTFPATESTITCPGGVPPTEEGECITKPGQGNDPI